MAVGDARVSWLSHTSTNTTYFSHMLLQRWKAKIRLKEISHQPGIELTFTRSWVRHVHHLTTRAGLLITGSPSTWLIQFKHIYFTSIEKQILSASASLYVFRLLGTKPKLAPLLWPMNGSNVKTPGSVFTNHSLERSLSYSPDFSIFRSIWMKHNFWLAKPYGLANQKLCYIQSYKSWRKRQRMFLRIVGEYGPRNQSLDILIARPTIYLTITDTIWSTLCHYVLMRLSAWNSENGQPITRRQNSRLVQIETNCRRHCRVHSKWKISVI